MIHISNDYIFSDKKGNIVETDQWDDGDLYGRSKFFGEVTFWPNTVTLYMTIVGREPSYWVQEDGQNNQAKRIKKVDGIYVRVHSK